MKRPLHAPRPRYRLPAEWEKHAATWLTWPHNTDDWPGKLSAVYWAFAEMVRRLAPGEPLRILVNNRLHEERARRQLKDAGAAIERVSFYRIPTNRSWIRDYGPLFLRDRRRKGQLVIPTFEFNGWGRYRAWRRDNEARARIARALKLPLLAVRRNNQPIILEGGSIDVNGRGDLLTTEACLLDEKDQVRNPGFTREAYEAVFERWLGIRRVIWLDGQLEGDDTHGHVDGLCRFVAPGVIAAVRAPNKRHPAYRALEENIERLQSARIEKARRPELVFLPLPQPLRFRGRPLPASYANFYIGNRCVLVPTFNDPADREALGILQECFPGRTVIGIHAVDLIWGLGAVHCLTRQQPTG